MLKSLSPIDVALIKKIGGNGSSYTLPIASSTVLGGVKPADKTAEMTQSVGVDEAGGLWTAPGSGGVSSTKMQETVLASGVVASGTAKWNKEDTGLTVADLQEWKVWGFVSVSSSQNTKRGLYFGANSVLMLPAAKNGRVVASWMDDEHKAINTMIAVSGDGFISMDYSFFRNGVGIGNGGSKVAIGGYIPFVNSNDDKVYFYNDSELTEDMAYKIVGLIK